VKRANTSSRGAVATADVPAKATARHVAILDARPANDVTAAGTLPTRSRTAPSASQLRAAAKERFLRLIARCIACQILAQTSSRETSGARPRNRSVRAKK
jgi:hypothetical protein